MDTLPKLCQSKKVCSRTFLDKVNQCALMGRVAVVKKALAENQLSWDFMGPYRLTFNEHGVATHVKHDSGEVATVPEDDAFTNTWKLFEPFSDEGAYVEAPKSKRAIKLKSYFDAGKGPLKVVPSLEDFAKGAHAELQKQLLELQSSLVPTEENNAVAQATRMHKKTMAQARASAMIAAKKKAKTDPGVALKRE